MPISVRMSEEELRIVKKYAKLKKTTVSDVVRKAILEKIEDEFDILIYENSLKEFEENPIKFTMEEASDILGLK